MRIGNAILLMSQSQQVQMYTNGISNGNFENNLNNWESYINNGITFTIETSPVYVGTGALKGIGTLSSVATIYRQAKSFVSGHKYFLSVWGNTIANNATNTGIRIYSGGTVKTTIYLTFSSINTWLRSSNIYIADGTENYIAVSIAETVANTTYLDGVICLDLTAIFGVGNEPDLTWCNANITKDNITW